MDESWSECGRRRALCIAFVLFFPGEALAAMSEDSAGSRVLSSSGEDLATRKESASAASSACLAAASPLAWLLLLLLLLAGSY